MPKRSKPPTAPRRSPSSRDFAVVLESLQGDFRVFGEALHGVQHDLEAVKQDVQGVKQSLVEFRTEVDARFDRVEGEIGLLKDAVLTNTRELKDHGRELKDQGRQLAELRVAVSRKVDLQA
jgi:hypothetical protein